MPKALHVTLAYLFLLLALIAIAKLAFTPFESRWQAHRENTRTLKLELRDMQQKRARQSLAQAELESSLREFTSAGKLSSAANPSEAALKLQTLVKSALHDQSARLQQLRPGRGSESQVFWQSRLEISFLLPAENIDSLLNQFSAYPNMHIELLSLREQKLFQRSANGIGSPADRAKALEANMTVTMWFVSDELKASFPELSAPEAEAISEASPSLPAQNTLAGLFNAQHRARWQAPSADYYRLAAVTVSDNVKVALIADADTNRTRRLTVGQMLDVWTVKAINASQVELSFGQRSETLRLKNQ